MRKIFDNGILFLQYAAAGTYMIMGITHDDTPGISIGLSMIILTALYHMEKRKASRYREMLESLPDDKIVARQAAKTASEFTQLNSFEKGIMEHGFMSGVAFIYKKLGEK